VNLLPVQCSSVPVVCVFIGLLYTASVIAVQCAV